VGAALEQQVSAEGTTCAPGLLHCAALRPQAVVTSLLADPKVEVRHLAAATLSGMIKGMHGGDREALQAQLLRRASQLFPSGRKRIKAAAGAGGAQVGRGAAGSACCAAAAAGCGAACVPGAGPRGGEGRGRGVVGEGAGQVDCCCC
jgi:hypothetical protein